MLAGGPLCWAGGTACWVGGTIHTRSSWASRNPLIENVDTQLDALERWTAGGREPSEAERKTIHIGLLAVRELDDVRDPEVEELVDKLYALQSYVDEWPTDDEAANATDEDYWKRFGL